MRTSSKPLPFPKLHKHTGQAYVRWQGRPKYFGKFGTDAAMRKYWAWVAEIANGVKMPAGVIATCLVADLFRLYREQHNLDRWQQSRMNNLEEFSGIHHFSTAEYGPLAFEEHRRDLLSTGTRCARQVNDLMQFAQRIFRWGVSRQLVPLEVWTMLKTVERLKPHESPKQTVRRKPVAAAIVAATLPYLSDHCADMVRLIVATGARPGEILSLKAEEIVKSYQARPGWWFAEKAKHKTASRGKRRWVEFPPECHALLLRRWPGACGFFFPVLCPRKGMTLHYTVAALRQALGHACDRAKVERFSPYQLRHMTLTDIAGREGLARAAEVAGHDPRVTESHYLHEPPKRAG